MNNIERINAADLSSANIAKNGGIAEGMELHGIYTVECRDANGELVWREKFKNLVTTAGKNNALDNQLAGSSYTATWYMGLISNTSYSAISAADTMASHAGWTESQNYSQTARPTTAWNAASGGSKSLSAALTFTMNATDTIKGCFLASVSTKGGTTGVLYSAGLFTGGDQPVVSGNTLSVSYTASA